MGDFLVVPEELNYDCRKTYAGTMGRGFTILYNSKFLFADLHEH
jgi:hypothetical protein